jgi:hypothetical protein
VLAEANFILRAWLRSGNTGAGQGVVQFLTALKTYKQPATMRFEVSTYGAILGRTGLSGAFPSPRRSQDFQANGAASRRVAWQRHDGPHRSAAVAGLDLQLSTNLPEAFAQAGDADADDHLLDALTQPGREAASFIADLELDSSHENEDDFSTSEFRLISPNSQPHRH